MRLLVRHVAASENPKMLLRLLTQCLLLVASTAVPALTSAQIALDHPIPIGTGDKVYLSVADPGLAYVFPEALTLKKGPDTFAIYKQYVMATFTVSVEQEYLDRVQNEVSAVAPGVKVRLFRGLNAVVLPRSATDIDPQFDAVLMPLGDPGALSEDVNYTLILQRRCWFFCNPALKELKEAFASAQPRNVGIIEYTFEATYGGQPFTGKTVIAIFVSSKEK